MVGEYYIDLDTCSEDPGLWDGICSEGNNKPYGNGDLPSGTYRIVVKLKSDGYESEYMISSKEITI